MIMATQGRTIELLLQEKERYKQRVELLENTVQHYQDSENEVNLIRVGTRNPGRRGRLEEVSQTGSMNITSSSQEGDDLARETIYNGIHKNKEEYLLDTPQLKDVDSEDNLYETDKRHSERSDSPSIEKRGHQRSSEGGKMVPSLSIKNLLKINTSQNSNFVVNENSMPQSSSRGLTKFELQNHLKYHDSELEDKGIYLVENSSRTLAHGSDQENHKVLNSIGGQNGEPLQRKLNMANIVSEKYVGGGVLKKKRNQRGDLRSSPIYKTSNAKLQEHQFNKRSHKNGSIGLGSDGNMETLFLFADNTSTLNSNMKPPRTPISKQGESSHVDKEATTLERETYKDLPNTTNQHDMITALKGFRALESKLEEDINNNLDNSRDVLIGTFRNQTSSQKFYEELQISPEDSRRGRQDVSDHQGYKITPFEGKDSNSKSSDTLNYFMYRKGQREGEEEAAGDNEYLSSDRRLQESYLSTQRHVLRKKGKPMKKGKIRQSKEAKGIARTGTKRAYPQINNSGHFSQRSIKMEPSSNNVFGLPFSNHEYTNEGDHYYNPLIPSPISRYQKEYHKRQNSQQPLTERSHIYEGRMVRKARNTRQIKRRRLKSLNLGQQRVFIGEKSPTL